MHTAARILSLLIIAGSWFGWEVLDKQPRGGPPAPFSALPRTPREDWAVALLKRLGNERPTDATVAMVVEWTLAEDRSDGAFARGNPLNTTMPSDAETMTINNDGVKGYESHSAGLDATVRTLTNGLYPDVVAALLANDPERAKQALWASPWAASRYNGGAGWPMYQVSAQNGAHAASSPLSLEGDVGANVRAALGANGGALQHVTIAPGATWSFGHTIAPISAMGGLATVGGVYAGGWCDLAARYLATAQQLGLETRYVQHAGVSAPFPSIWLNEWGEGESGQDLYVRNGSTRAAHFQARIEGEQLIIEGGFGQHTAPLKGAACTTHDSR